MRMRVVVSGLVQGVFFRHYTKEHALRYNLTGWVKNRPDGKVEAVFEGKKENLSRMANWCYQGSPSSQVIGVDIEHEEPTGEFSRFQIIYD